MSVVIDSDNNNVNITEEPINVTVSLGGPDVAAVWGGITGDITEQEDLQTALDDKVPYTGASSDVNLGEYGIQLGNLEFDNTPTNVPTAAGSVYWSDTDGTLNMVLKGGQTISRIGETQHIRALNNTGAQIARGKVVYVVGAQGQRLTIALADADTEILSKDTIGFTSEAIADGAEGFVIVQGVINNISTTGMTDGATVYLSQTAGSYTTTPPVDPAHLVVLGFIVNGGSGGAGSIYVKVDNGYELGELHDVDTTGATNGQVLTYNGTTWIPATNGSGTVTSIATSAPITGGTITTSGTIGITQAGAAADGYLSSVDWNTFNNKQAALTLTTTGTSGAATLVGSTLNIPQYQGVLTNPVTGTGTAGQVSYWSGTDTQTGSSNLFYDAANNRLGIGTNAPNRLMQLSGTDRRLLSVYNTGNNSSLIMFQNAQTGVADGDGFAIGIDDSENGWLHNYENTNTIFTTNANERLRITSAGNVLVNNTDGTGRLTVRGSGTTSATTALLVQNSTPSALMQITDDGTTTLTGTTTTSVANLVLANSTSSLWAFRNNGQISQVSSNQSFNLYPQSQGTLGTLATSGDLSLVVSNTRAAGGTLPNGVLFLTKSNTDTNTSGIIRYLYLNHISTNAFAPTSGTGQFILTELAGTINQTGGANGITRGLYVNPTLTSAADWRSVEFSNNTGWGLYGAGTANNYLAGSLGIGTTSLTGYTIRLQKDLTGATSAFGVYQAGQVQSSVTSSGVGFRNDLTIVDATFTISNYFHFQAAQGTIGASATLTNQFGFRVNSSLTGATNNYGFYGDIASGTGRWNLYMNGTAANYLAGNTSIGTTTSSGRLTVRGAGTTSATNGLLVEDSAGTDTFTIRDDGGYAFRGGTVGLAQTGYTTFTNLTTDRTCDANATTVEELADILGTLIEDLKTKGIIAA